MVRSSAAWSILALIAALAVATLLPVVAVADEVVLPTGTSLLQDDSRRVTFTGRWTYVWDTSYSGYSVRRSASSGAKAALRFEGTGVGLVAPRGPDGGIAALRIGSSTVATVSLYAAAPETSSVVWWSGELSPGTRTLTVAVTGKREASSTGTAVRVDGFRVAGRTIAPKTPAIIQESDHRVYRKGTWGKRVSASASKGFARRAAKKGASIKLTFKGTSVTWIGRKSPGHGLAEVILDGRRVAVVGGAPGSARERVVLWSATGLANKKHTVVIRALGEPSGGGTTTSVDVDGFIVSGTTLFTPRPTPFKYPWKTYIVVDKSEFRLYWVKNKTLVKTYPIAHGRQWGYTPQAVWRIDSKYHSSGVYGPRKMRLWRRVGTRGGYRYVYTRYGIHGTNNPPSIGTMASAGCIRMYNRDVLDLFPRVPLGTMVVTRD